MKKLSSYLSLRITIFTFFVLFLFLTISSYVSEKRLESAAQMDLRNFHQSKIAIASKTVAENKPVMFRNDARQIAQNILNAKINCEEISDNISCQTLKQILEKNYFITGEYKDIALFNATGTRVFYQTAIENSNITPKNISPKPSSNNNFKPYLNIANAYTGKPGTSPENTLLTAFEIASDTEHLGTFTLIKQLQDLNIFGTSVDSNFVTYSIDESGNIKNLSGKNSPIITDAQVIDACKQKSEKVITYSKDNQKRFAISSFLSNQNICIVTETNNERVSAAGTNTFIFNYTGGLIILFVLWSMARFVANKISKKLISIREKAESVLLGKEVTENKLSKIQEIDELNKTFDFILHKLKEGSQKEIADSALEKNILQKAKSTAASALASRDTFKEAVESAQDTIVILSRTGLVNYANKSLEKITGFRLENVEGKYPYETWLKPESTEEFKNSVASVIKNKTSLIINSEGKRASGGGYESEIRLSPIENIQTGVVDSVLMIERDISEEKQRDRVKTEFISIVSHELRTPMTVIRGYSSLLAEGKLGELNLKQKEYMDRINSETTRLLELANDMLDLQKFDAGKADLNLEKLNLKDMLEDLANEFEPLFNKKGVTITFENHASNPNAQIDKRYLRRAITNLIQNALKFTEKGSVSVFVVNPDKDYVVAAIKDTGTGIPEEALPHLFTKFYQASNVLNRKQEGSGLGLSIVKKIVEAHRGMVWVESLEGKGTTFYIALPTA